MEELVLKLYATRSTRSPVDELFWIGPTVIIAVLGIVKDSIPLLFGAFGLMLAYRVWEMVARKKYTEATRTLLEKYSSFVRDATESDGRSILQG